jgi:hypothetical protein
MRQHQRRVDCERAEHLFCLGVVEAIKTAFERLAVKRDNPMETWRMVSEYIKTPMDTRGFVITRWLRGDISFSGRNPGPMRHIPREEIWSWIEADPEARAIYVATMVPKDFTAEAWKDSLIREILCRFGDSKKVQSAVLPRPQRQAPTEFRSQPSASNDGARY